MRLVHIRRVRDVAMRVAVLAALCLWPACSVRVFAEPDTDAYRDVWKTHWTSINRDAQGWVPSGLDPGACNKGGSANACYDVSQRVVEGLQSLRAALKTISVPTSYEDAHLTLLRAVDLEIAGLQDRNEGIIRSDDVAFQRGVNELAQARDLFVRAWEQFPATDKPEPPPFEAGFTG